MPDETKPEISWPPPPTSQDEYQGRVGPRFHDLTQITAATLVLLVVNVCLVFLKDFEISLISSYFLELGTVIVSYMVSIGALLCFVIWTYFAYRNLMALGRKTRHHPGSAIAFFFVPIANLFMPCVVFCELFSLSTDNQESDTSSLPMGWWILWIVYVCAALFGDDGAVFIGFANGGSSRTASLDLMIVKIGRWALLLVVTILSSLLIHKIARRQNTAFENMIDGDPSVSTTRRR